MLMICTMIYLANTVTVVSIPSNKTDFIKIKNETKYFNHPHTCYKYTCNSSHYATFRFSVYSKIPGKTNNCLHAYVFRVIYFGEMYSNFKTITPMATKGKYGKIVFSDSDIAYIKDNFKRMTNTEMAATLGLKSTTLRTKAYALGLKRMELEYWTKDQVQFLKDNYKTIGDTELAEIFEVKWFKQKGWNKRHIEKKRRYLKLKRTPAELKAINHRNIYKGRYAMCAKKMWEVRGEAPEGTKRVWFRKNNAPFVVIKTKTGFVSYNRWLYKKHVGPIPPGVNVCLKLGTDAINYTSKDLELLTDAELASRNSKSQTPPQLKETIKLIKQLNRIILKQKKDDSRD